MFAVSSYLIVGSKECVVDSEQNVLPLVHDFCNPGNVTQTEQRVRWSLQVHESRVDLQGIFHVLWVRCIHVRSGDTHSPGYLQTWLSFNCVGYYKGWSMNVVTDAVPAFAWSLEKCTALISLNVGDCCFRLWCNRRVRTCRSWELSMCDADRYVPAAMSLKTLSFCP